jgi:hypothetical protein
MSGEQSREEYERLVSESLGEPRDDLASHDQAEMLVGLTDSEQIVELLSEILEELRELRSDFQEFTGYNVYKMSTVVDDLGDRITGGAGGVGGADLDEVRRSIDAIENAIDMK